MWFVLGALCGGVTCYCLRNRKSRRVTDRVERTVHKPSKEWVETRNFLYYDGTVMPEIKEDLHEQ